jgi:hypothetical protein
VLPFTSLRTCYLLNALSFHTAQSELGRSYTEGKHTTYAYTICYVQSTDFIKQLVHWNVRTDLLKCYMCISVCVCVREREREICVCVCIFCMYIMTEICISVFTDCIINQSHNLHVCSSR